jgi:DNA mismatch repair protein MutL
LIERLERFYGGELAGQLISIEAQVGDARLWGYVAHPAESKSTRKGQYLFLNGRWIQDRSLQHALGEAYRGLLMVGRYPVAFLFLEIPPDDVDVNVHPTKSEVRFRDSQQLYRLVLSTLRTKFLSMDIGAGHRLAAGSAATDAPGLPVGPQQQRAAQQDLVNWARQHLAGWRPNTDLSDLEARLSSPLAAEPFDVPGFPVNDRPDIGGGVASAAADPRWDAPADIAAVASNSGLGESPTETPPRPSIQHVATDAAVARPASADAEVRAMQVHDCYLVIETPAGLTVIDQHALHERILYEHLRRRVLDGGVEVQRLLMPITVELSPREAALVIDQQEVLQELGLLVEAFGGSTVAVTGYPILTRKADPVVLVKAVVEQLEQTDSQVSRRDLLDSLLHMLACKAAIKAGQRLSPEEIESLLAQRHLVDDAHHCPHGRPTALTLSRQDLDRQFGRLG